MLSGARQRDFLADKAIDQQRINDFADVTEDRQWIHTDVERAKAAAVERFRFPTTCALTQS
jgi:acyl dehydratase